MSASGDFQKPLNLFRLYETREVKLANVFLHPINVQQICQTIAKELTNLFSQPINFVCSDDFSETLVNLMLTNSGWWAHDDDKTLQRFNTRIVKEEMKVQYFSLKNRHRYFNDIIDQNRNKTYMEYPKRADETLAKEYRPDTSQYVLSNPINRHRQEFLQSVYRIN